MRRSLRRGAALLAALFCLPALSAAQEPAKESAPQKTPLKLTLDRRIDVVHAPLFVALEAGLDVSVAPGANGVEAIARVASGAFDVGLADINAVIRYRDQNPNAPVKVVFVLANRPGYAVIGRKSRGVNAPQDLNGKRLGLPATEYASAVWPVFARLNGIDLGKVETLNLGVAVRAPMLAAGEVDAVTGTTAGIPITLRERGVPADDIATLLMARFGLALYGSSVIVNAAVLAERPEAVRAFLGALTAGMQATVRDPAAAVAAVIRRAGSGNAAIELERLQAIIRDTFATEEAHANGLGDIVPARFETGLEQIALSYTFKNKPRLGDLFDPSFLPPPEARRLN